MSLMSPKALEAEIDIGLLLSCNVVVFETDSGCVVEAMDPEPVVALVGKPGLAPVAAEVGRGLRAAIERVEVESRTASP